MKERDLENRCMEKLEARLPTKCHLWKIHDEVTAGQPDLEINYKGFTTKIEFKVLKKDETIHDKWEDERQLITCLRYEQTTTRCWVVAFKQHDRRFPKSEDETIIYRPSALLDRKIPEAVFIDRAPVAVDFCRLWDVGAIRFRGFNYDAIVALIRTTHQS